MSSPMLSVLKGTTASVLGARADEGHTTNMIAITQGAKTGRTKPIVQPKPPLLRLFHLVL